MIIEKGGKKFEKPDAGMFLGTIVDVVDLGLVASKNPKFPDPQVRIRIIWVLDKNDSEGRPFRVMEQPTAKLSDGGGNTKKSRLYEICEGVFQTAPPAPFDSELLMGRSNLLFLVKEGEYTNIKGFLAVPPGQTPPVAPADFVRAKNRPATQASGQTSTPAGGNTSAQTQTEEDVVF